MMKPSTMSFASTYGPSVTVLLLPSDHLARSLERLPRIREVSLALEITDPGQPRLHALLRAIGRTRRFATRRVVVSKEKDELAHR
jgi:hypothetical protein